MDESRRWHSKIHMDPRAVRTRDLSSIYRDNHRSLGARTFLYAKSVSRDSCIVSKDICFPLFSRNFQSIN